MLPKFPRFDRNSLRPNPVTADSEAAFPFVQDTVLVGHFADDWGARGHFANGLPSASAKPGGLGAGLKATNVQRDRLPFRV